MKLGDRLRSILGHRRLPVLVTTIAVALCAPALWLGLQNDDWVLRLFLMTEPLAPEWSRSPTDAFLFANGDQELVRRIVETGRLPWWAHPQLKLAFFRPLTSITHWADFRLWPDQPWLMHIQSLLWFAGAVAVAALLYRRLIRSAWIAGLAALLFAVDDGHGMPAVWLSNRNASIGVLFGLLALVAHDRWRRDGWRHGAWASPIALTLGLLGGEIALATGGYLLAYALLLDTGSWRRRLASLIPCATVGVVWWVTYRVMGYGAFGSGLYVDPGANPIAFGQAVMERAPALLFGQWVFPSSLYVLLSQRAAHVLWLVAMGLVVVIGALLLPLLRRSRMARFFALGMVLSLLPACATFPDDRLLFLAGFGGMGLLAQFLAAVWQRDVSVPASRILRLPFQVACWLFVVIHLVFAPLGLATTSDKVRTFGTFIERAAKSLPAEPAVVDQTVLIVNTPCFFISNFSPLIQALQGRPIPRQTLILAPGIYPLTVTRPEDKVLTMRPDGGFLMSPGSPRPGHEASQPAFDPLYFHQVLDNLCRDATPMRLGERIPYGGTTAEVTALTEDGRPAEVSFHFDVALEDSSLVWLQWDDGVYAPFEPPGLGETAVLPSVTMPW